MLPRLANEAPEAHYRSMLENYYKNLPNFHGICGVTVTKVDTNGVQYLSADHKEHKINCDSILYSVGMTENFQQAMSLFGAVANTRMIGDCEKAGNVQKAMRSAYAAAMQI